ncbi:MAG: 2'-5' RNA ligase family protein [Lachnospiraceae bacterium]|nr:2'-5' RNA ligase family protein [Lachnospiraceae bacterium]
MYLISLYFDEKTEKAMQSYINQVAKATGNAFMVDGKIPPHITLLAFDTQDESKAVELLDRIASRLKSGSLYFASMGVLKGQVLYIEPVLNQYLHSMEEEIYEAYIDVPDIKFSPYYKPFGWIPHMSVGKHLDERQMEEALKVMLKQFVPSEGIVTRIGIAKTNPHRDIKVFEL